MGDLNQRQRVVEACPPRVLMIGPASGRKGGIAAVVGSYLDHWNYETYDLRHIASAADTKRLYKLLRFLWSIIDFCYQSIFWRPEIVHIHFGWGASYYRKSLFIVLARLFPVNIVLHCHTGRFSQLYENRTLLSRRFIRFTIESADLILVVSETLKNYFDGLSLGIPVCLLNNAVDSPDPSQIQRSREPIVLSMGRLGPRKGTYDILQAVPRVVAEIPDAEFWLAGDGEYASVARIIAQNEWGKHVRLLGWVQGEEKQNYLTQANVFLLPSYFEGTPVAILEAMAYGLPVVSCSVGGIPALISEGKTGFLVEPGDVDAMVEKLLLLLNDEALCQTLGSAGQDLIRKSYDIESNLHRLFALYDALLNGTISCNENPSSIEPQH